MSNDIIKGNWKEIKGKLKETWGKLTDDEVTETEGTSEKLLGHLQKHYGYQKHEAQKQIDDFAKKHNLVDK